MVTCDIQGFPRDQVVFQLFSLDEILDKENFVRAIDAFVNSLCLKNLGVNVYSKNKPGQQPYEREDLLKILIYGYFNQIRSSRSLETECKRNLELMWLVNGIHPDHGTTSLFLKENRRSFKEIMRTFTCLLKGWGLIDGKLIAIDGTKIRAQNSKRNYLSPDRLSKKLEYIDEKIEHYLSCLDDASYTESLSDEKASIIASKIEEYNKKKRHLSKMKIDMENSGKKQLTITEPDSQAM